MTYVFVPMELQKGGKTIVPDDAAEDARLRFDGWLPVGAPPADHSNEYVRVGDIGDGSTPAGAELRAAYAATVLAPLPSGGDDTATHQALIDANAGKIIQYRPGTYLVSQLLLPDNTYLDLGGAVFQRTGNTAGAAGGATIRNADQTNGNSNITVRGGTITSGSGTSGRPWSMVAVTNLRVSDVQINKGSSTFTDWMFHFERCTTVRVDNCWISGGTAVGEDGLHIKSTQDMVVNNCILEAGDDALTLVHEFNQTRAIRNVTISNCVLASHSAHALRISVISGETQVIENVALSNIVIRPPASGTPTGNCVVVEDQTNTGLARRISMDNVAIDATGYPGNAVTVTNVNDSTFSNWRVLGATNRSFLFTNCVRMDLSNCIADTPAASTGNPQWALTSCTAMTLVGCESRDSRIWGWVVSGTGSSDITFLGCRAANNAQQAWSLITAARVAIIGCTVIGGTAPITCDTTNPPSQVRVIGNQFSGNTGTEIVNPPATLTYLGNTDNSNRGAQFPNTKVGFFGTTPVAKATVSGAKGGNAALASLLTALAAMGLITDTSTA